mmetsp:Transcript_61474/g.146369  ORF Transcript_61474/g.146369 Transcript_61474/m.146369 type:complete len:203 (-) Transcript_61474:590-1198(-)
MTRRTNTRPLLGCFRQLAAVLDRNHRLVEQRRNSVDVRHTQDGHHRLCDAIRPSWRLHRAFARPPDTRGQDLIPIREQRNQHQPRQDNGFDHGKRQAPSASDNLCDELVAPGRLTSCDPHRRRQLGHRRDGDDEQGEGRRALGRPHQPRERVAREGDGHCGEQGQVEDVRGTQLLCAVLGVLREALGEGSRHVSAHALPPPG